MTTELKKLFLHDYHAKIMQNLLRLLAGKCHFLTEVQLDEHNGVRTDARVFDVSHMGQLKVSGPSR